MQIKDVMRASFGRSKMVTDMLLADFTDAEILVCRCRVPTTPLGNWAIWCPR